MRFIVLAVSLTLPAQAFALSCVKPSVEFSYASAANSEETFLLGTGTLVFDRNLVPRSTTGLDLPPKETVVSAMIKGKAFDGTGFEIPFETEVEMVVRCIQSWCPVVESDKEHLVFLKEAETKYTLAIDPCGGAAFPEPTREMLDQVLTCFKEGNCSVDPS